MEEHLEFGKRFSVVCNDDRRVVSKSADDFIILENIMKVASKQLGRQGAALSNAAVDRNTLHPPIICSHKVFVIVAELPKRLCVMMRQADPRQRVPDEIMTHAWEGCFKVKQ